MWQDIKLNACADIELFIALGVWAIEDCPSHVIMSTTLIPDTATSKTATLDELKTAMMNYVPGVLKTFEEEMGEDLPKVVKYQKIADHVITGSMSTHYVLQHAPKEQVERMRDRYQSRLDHFLGGLHIVWMRYLASKFSTCRFFLMCSRQLTDSTFDTLEAVATSPPSTPTKGSQE